jgi:hypothetical protein
MKASGKASVDEVDVRLVSGGAALFLARVAVAAVKGRIAGGNWRAITGVNIVVVSE